MEQKAELQHEEITAAIMEIEEVQINIRQFLPDRCAACQELIAPGADRTRVELEKYTHHARVFLACSEECAEILREA